MNAIEWGGKLDPNAKVPIAYLRPRRMVPYWIADPVSRIQVRGFGARCCQLPACWCSGKCKRYGKKEVCGRAGSEFSSREMMDELIYNEAHNEVVFVLQLQQVAVARPLR